MKREARQLLGKATDSLLLTIELFNRPYDRGRVTAILILLDHAFEMLLKAAILYRGGRIREARSKETIGFDKSVRVGLSDGAIKFLTEEQALLLQTINGLRDAAQHHLLSISEAQLYIHVQSGFTLFRDLMIAVFGQELTTYLPKRVLPISTMPPTDLVTLFTSEIDQLRRLLNPGRRQRVEVLARLRPLAILDTALRGEKQQPSESELRRIGRELMAGKDWTEIFVGVAAIELTPEGSGLGLSLRITKKEGSPVHLVSEGTPGASVVAIKRVNELDFYNMGARQLAARVGLTTPKLVAVVRYLQLQNDPECYKEIRIGKVSHKRYSPKAIEKIRSAIQLGLDVDAVWCARKAEPPRV
jgi:hypothetical protein